MARGLRIVVGVCLLLVPLLMALKLREPPWVSQVELSEVEGRPVTAFVPWWRWRPAMGDSDLQFAYAPTTQPAGPQDWRIEPCRDPKLSTCGRESVYNLALQRTLSGLDCFVFAHYLRPDGQRLQEGFLRVPVAKAPGAVEEPVSEITGKLPQFTWNLDAVTVAGKPLLFFHSLPDNGEYGHTLLRVLGAELQQTPQSRTWSIRDLDITCSVTDISAATDGAYVYVCYITTDSLAANASGIVLQRGTSLGTGGWSWNAERVLNSGDNNIVSVHLLASTKWLYLFCITDDGLMLLQCPLQELLTRENWPLSCVYASPVCQLQDAILLDDLPALVLTIDSGACVFALATTPQPAQPADWSWISFPTAQQYHPIREPDVGKQGAIALVGDTLAIAYQCEAPRGLAYAWAKVRQPRLASDWNTNLVFHEASLTGIQRPYYGREETEDGSSQLKPPLDIPAYLGIAVSAQTWPATAPVRAVASSKNGAAFRYYLFAGALIVLIAAMWLIWRRMSRRRQRRH